MRASVPVLMLLILVLSCGDSSPSSTEHLARLGRQLERTRSSDTAAFLLLDLETIAETQPRHRSAVLEIIEPHADDPRHVVRAVAVRALASLQPDDAIATTRLQSYLMDPHEPLGLRNALLAHPAAAELPSREEALALLRRQAEQTGRSITHE